MPHICQWPLEDEDICGRPAHNSIESEDGSMQQWFCAEHYDFMAQLLRQVAEDENDAIGDTFARIVRRNKL